MRRAQRVAVDAAPYLHPSMTPIQPAEKQNAVLGEIEFVIVYPGREVTG
jgi:hypothetical protein